MYQYYFVGYEIPLIYMTLLCCISIPLSYIWYSFVMYDIAMRFVTWLGQVCFVIRHITMWEIAMSQVWHNWLGGCVISTWQNWVMCVYDTSCITKLFYVCDVSHIYTGERGTRFFATRCNTLQHRVIHETWLIHTRVMAHLHVRRGRWTRYPSCLTWLSAHKCMTLLSHVCDMSDIYTCERVLDKRPAPALIHTCEITYSYGDMTHSHVRYGRWKRYSTSKKNTCTPKSSVSASKYPSPLYLPPLSLPSCVSLLMLLQQRQPRSCNWRYFLQYTARHCNTLQHTATHYCTATHCSPTATIAGPFCDTLQRTATHCNALQRTAPHCNNGSPIAAIACPFCDTLQHTATYCNTLQHTATHCNTAAQRPWLRVLSATHCNILQHTAKRCNALQCASKSLIQKHYRAEL